MACGLDGHSGIWISSSVLGERQGQKMYVSSVLLASSVLASGNNFEKVSLLAKSMNLHFVSSTTFSRFQSLYAVPGIRDLWDKMKEVVWKVFENDVLVLCGDGRMDSPGFNAKYCVYTMMEHYLSVIVDLEVIDKHEAGGTSTLMEKMGCKRLLERMMHSLNLGELVTDASKAIMKNVRELKGMVKQHYYYHQSKKKQLKSTCTMMYYILYPYFKFFCWGYQSRTFFLSTKNWKEIKKEKNKLTIVSAPTMPFFAFGVSLDTKPLSESEAQVDLVLIQTLLLLICKSISCNAKLFLVSIVSRSTQTSLSYRGLVACKMVYSSARYMAYVHKAD